MPKKNKLTDVQLDRLNQLKFQLCHAIDRSIHRNQWSYADAARMLRVDKVVISRITNKKIERLTLNQLFEYLVRVRPNFEFLVSV